MRKLFVVCLLLWITFFSFTGCSDQKATVDNSPTADVKETPMNLTFLGTSATGPGLITMNGLAECVNKNYPNSIITIVPGNLGTNVTRINNSEADVAMTDNVFVLAGTNGKAPFNQKMDNLAALAYLQRTSFQIIVNSKLEIDSFDEIIQNKMKLRISSGLAGGAWPVFLKNLLAEYGLTIDDMTDWGCEILYQGIDDSAQMLGDDRIDVMIAGVFVPTPTIQELSRNKDIKLLKLDPAVMKKMCEKHGYYQSVITVNTYDFLTEDINCINTNAILIVPKDSPDESVYKITQSIDENLDYLRTVHASFSDISSDKLVNELDFPLHPGAEKYYREKGIIK